MRQRRVWLGRVICCLVLAIAGAASAACVTPKDIKDKATATATAMANSEAIPANKCKFVHDLVAALSTAAGSQLTGNTIAAQSDALKNSASSWDRREPLKTKQGGADVITPDSLKDFLKLIQDWANFGEIVVLVTNNEVALIVPGKSVVGTSGNWQDFPIPRIAHAGNPIINGSPNKYTVSAETGPQLDIDDPKSIVVYRYRD